MGVTTSFDPSIPLSVKMSKAYFLWHKEMPLEDLATSNPRKNFKFPRSFNLNSLCRESLRALTDYGSLLAKRISSTYTNNAIKDDPCVLVNKE